MQTRAAGSHVKSSRPTASPPAADDSAPTPSPSKKRQKLRPMEASALVYAGDQSSCTAASGTSQHSFESGSQSAFIERMESFNIMCCGSQSSVIDAGGADDTRASWAFAPPGIRPRLQFGSQASRESACSSETVAAESFDILNSSDMGAQVLPAGAKSGRAFEVPAESMSVTAGSGLSGFSATGSTRSTQNPFLPPVACRLPPFGAPPTPRDNSIFDSKFEREFTVGCGAFAEVCVARNRLEGTIYAVKRVRAVITGERMQRRILHEVYALSVLRGGPNIVQYFDSWVDSSHLWICTELCLKETLMSFLTYGRLLARGVRFFDPSSGGSSLNAGTPRFSTVSYDEYELSQQGLGAGSSQPHRALHRTQSGPHALHRNLSTASAGGAALETPPPGGYAVGEALAWIVVESIGSALAFMHGNGIAHLDVKPGNILISASSYFELEAIYGRLRSVTEYSREHFEHLAEMEPKLISGQWKLKLGDFGNCCALDAWAKLKEEGDTRYCAEELVFADSPDLAAADVFSLGATVYELCSGELLPDSQDCSHVWKDVRRGRLAHFDQMRRPSSALSLLMEEDGSADSSRLSPAFVTCIEKMMSPVEAGARPAAAGLQRSSMWLSR